MARISTLHMATPESPSQLMFWLMMPVARSTALSTPLYAAKMKLNTNAEMALEMMVGMK